VVGIQFINAGSVGRAKDGDWRACYLLLHPDPESPAEGETWVRPEFVRIEYGLPRAADAIRSSTLPNEFATALEKGGG